MKRVIPHKCMYCNGELWFNTNNRNYGYNHKKGLYYCDKCGIRGTKN